MAKDGRVQVEHRVLALELLRKECSRYERTLAHRTRAQFSLDPGIVLRYDGAPDPTGIEPTKYVTFCAVPLLQALVPPKTVPSQVMGGRRHHMRSLHRCSYESGDFAEHDTRQVFQRLDRNTSADQKIYVPQIWFLICGNSRSHSGGMPGG